MLSLHNAPPWLVHLMQLFHAEVLREEERKRGSGSSATHIISEKPPGAPDWMP